MPTGVAQEYPAATDLIEGDPSSVEVLHIAGVTRARYVLALRDDDAENAFIVLAAKEATGENGAKTVALVNTSKHLEKIRRVQPDLVFSVQLLGAELLTRAINGEPMDSQAITDLFFAKSSPEAKAS